MKSLTQKPTTKKVGFIPIFFVLCAGLFLLFTSASKAGTNIDSKGKEFWISFLPNYHNNPESLEDSLYIFIAADSVCSGTIEYYNASGSRFTQNFSITDISKIFTFKIPFDKFELIGYNESGRSLNNANSQNERIARQAFHITSDKEVTVYGLNQARTTSDAFLAFPVDALGNNYTVMSYNSDGKLNVGNILSTSSTPSEIAIVATENATSVMIIPSVPTQLNARASQTITLQKGEVYLVQAEISADSLTHDLTGTRIIATKPVAVFTGHQRSTIPFQNADDLLSRDHLCEQLLPVETWGKSAFIVPFAKGTGESSLGTDVFRVLAAFDSTEISIDGVSVGTFSAGKFYEDSLLSSGRVTANKPILVAQFKKTSQDGFNSNDPNVYGDPFMMFIPPSEQYARSYRVISAQAFDSQTLGTIYKEQYLTIIAPTARVASVRVDNVPPAASFFQVISGTQYSYANLRVGDGVHVVNADTTIGVYVYGFGVANSYGYIGGLGLEKITVIPVIKDTIPPVIASKAGCFTIKGTVFDSLKTDKKLKSVTAPQNLLQNTSINVIEFTPVRDSVQFEGRLIDNFRDGSFTIIAVDSAGLELRQKFDIPGFTMRMDTTLNANDMGVLIDSSYVNKQKCLSFSVVNYGNFPQILDTIALTSVLSQFSWQNLPTFPVVIPAGGKIRADICFSSAIPGKFADSILIRNSCLTRRIGAIRVEITQDIEPVSCANISGVINSYAVVSAIHYTSNTLTISSTAGFTVGAQVMLLQMNGAEIDTSDSPKYGTISRFNGAGNYEFAVIKEIFGKKITLTKPLQHDDYNTNYAVQLVSVPEYDHATVTGDLTAKAWDGATGGVLAFVANCMILQGNIDVTGKGFRGGAYLNVYNSISEPNDTMYVTSDAFRGARKGEGIAGWGVAPNLNAKGSPAQGGGGGNNHNAGGGGGGSYASGGTGGFGYSGVWRKNKEAGGLGGKSLSTEILKGKLFLGGGGGAGHANNGNGSAGASGGGLIFLRASTIIVPNSVSIRADGANAGNDSAAIDNDGCGGGGGAGSIMISAKKIGIKADISAVGGKGGSRLIGYMPVGLGGGGAGGAVLLTDDVPVHANVSGGLAGTDPQGGNYGAENGKTGAVVRNFLPEGTMKKQEFTDCKGCAPMITAAQSKCGGYFLVITDATYPIQSVQLVSGQSSNVTITVQNPLPAKIAYISLSLLNQNLDGTFTLKAINSQNKETIFGDIVLSTPPKPVIRRSRDTLSVALTGFSYEWFRDDILLPFERTNRLITSVAGVYKVKITNANGCSAVSDSVVIASTVGVNEQAGSEEPVLYPNPHSSAFTCQLFLEQPSNVRIELINILGELVAAATEEAEAGNFSQRISTDGLAGGVYFVRIQAGGRFWMKKVVKE